MQLMKEIRLTLTTYNTINAYRRAQAQLSDEGFTKFCNSNRPMMKFMEEVWKLQEDEPDATDG